MRSKLVALTRQAVREVWLAPALATAAGLGLVAFWFPLSDKTRLAGWTPPVSPLLPLVVAALWAGMATTGASRARWAYLLARPVARAQLLWVPIAVLYATLALGIAVVTTAATATALPASVFPESIMCAAIGLAAACGLWAGAVRESDVERAGLAVVGMLAMLGVPTLLFMTFGVSWPRADHVLGAAAPAAVIGLAATALWPLTALRGQLPHRSLAGALRVFARVAAVFVLHLAAFWLPTLHHAARPEHGEVVAHLSQPGLAVLTLTGSRPTEGSDLAIDGALLEGGEVLDLGRLASWRGDKPTRRVEEVVLDPSGRHVAFRVRPQEPGRGRSLVVLDAAAEQIAWATGPDVDLRDARFSDDGRFIALAADSSLVIARADSGEVVRSDEPRGPVGVLGWSAHAAVFEEHSGRVRALDVDGSSRTLLDEGRVDPQLGPRERLGWITPTPNPLMPTPAKEAVALTVQGPHGRTKLELAPKPPSWAKLLNWVDADHVAVLTSRDGARLKIVPLDGSKPTAVPVESARRVHGPAHGPWLIEQNSALRSVGRDGQVAWSERVRLSLGDARRNRVPLAWTDQTVSGVRVDGTTFVRPLPWKELAP